jgi:hypothetical protein
MANETTTTTLDDLTHTSLIEPYLIAALSEQPGLFRHCKEYNLIGKATKAAKIPTETSWWGSANDDGAGVDTEWNATEATALSNTAVSTGSITITAAEYGVAIELTDNVEEDSVNGLDLLGHFEQRMLHVISLAMDDDFCALFSGLSNVVGTSGSDLTVANLLSAQTDLRTRGVNAEGVVYIIDNQQASDGDNAFIATNSAQAVYAMAADRVLAYNPQPGHGMTTRMISTLRGFPVFSSGLTDTANTGADVVGSCFVPSSAYNDNAGHVTFGMAWKRLPRFETDRTAKNRSTDLVMTTRWGCGEQLDGSGTGIVTDA